MAAAAEKSLHDLALANDFRFEELVDRQALGELAESFCELFGIPLRVFGEKGRLLADASPDIELYAYLNTLKGGRAALNKVVSDVKSIEPKLDHDEFHTCVTGALYRVCAIGYDGRCIGRLIIGPFVPASLKEVPQSLLDVDADIDPSKARALLARMPRAREETIERIAKHLSRALDLILFSGHKALLTSSMHLASVRESFRQLEEKNNKLQVAYDRLKELDRLKSNFLATVSHELRTPLTSIIGYSEMLSEGIAGDLNDEQRDFVSTIHEKGEQLLELIRGLLDLSKLESGTMSLRKQELQVEDVIADVAQTITPAARKKDVDVEVHIEAGLPRLWADPERLRQVLLNLTENAIKFTPAAGIVTLSASLTMMEAEPLDEDSGGVVLLSARRTAIEIRVADTGIGIPEAERSRVFDAFYQVDGSSTREQGGTGLGLSIVKRLVDGHDGQIRIESNQPKGTVFVVTIPCRRPTLS